MAAFLARRLLLAAAVLLVVSYGTFVVFATKFTTQCPSALTPTNVAAPPLAGSVHDASILYWDWLKRVPSGGSFETVCGIEGSFFLSFWPSVGHTAVLLGLAMTFVVVFSLLLGTIGATRSGSAVDVVLRAFSYATWAVPAFVLAVVLQNVLEWAKSHHGFTTFAVSGWPGSCEVTPFSTLFGQQTCPHLGTGTPYALAVLQSTFVPALALSLSFIGLHSRYLRSALLVSLTAPYTTTAYAKGLSERRVVLRHALRNSLATFTSALLLDMGAIFGAAMVVDWVFGLGGLGTLFLTLVHGIGAGDGPRYLDAYSIENVVTLTAIFVLTMSILAEVAVRWLDPRARVA